MVLHITSPVNNDLRIMMLNPRRVFGKNFGSANTNLTQIKYHAYPRFNTYLWAFSSTPTHI